MRASEISVPMQPVYQRSKFHPSVRLICLWLCLSVSFSLFHSHNAQLGKTRHFPMIVFRNLTQIWNMEGGPVRAGFNLIWVTPGTGIPPLLIAERY